MIDFIYYTVTLYNKITILRMPSSGLWRRVGIVRTDVSEESVASMFRVEIICELVSYC
jgi:hypothetical protein